ncbi:type II toxin-antitoxin system HicB family antitoxin [Undibacterium amnicola]|uniref:Type II toxin-antitoxin system HicB family antitoxin n=1 Tax=Undibacterium amnicola TaxID=1834038 RepID=A0ABR6XND6_9BURK|nr:type II toxin-antitoxin system HicB family antitoxin [Undibacterium amnicola]MBC3830946.1 type II toxin-antitoxin system HicB family antitoxin [Undibacterium amnicola]
MQYPALFTRDELGLITVTFRDIPEALTQGRDEIEAKENAQDALITAMEFYFEDRRSVPTPSGRCTGEVLIPLPFSISVKVALLNEMIAQGVSAAELARRLESSPQNVNRIMKLDHATKIDTLDSAFKQLGKSLDFVVA